MNSHQTIEYKSFQIRSYRQDNGWTAEILNDNESVAYPPIQGRASLAKALGDAYEDADWLILQKQESLEETTIYW